MKAVILSGTASSRAKITEHLSVSDNVEKPVIKSDQVLAKKPKPKNVQVLFFKILSTCPIRCW